MSRHIVRGVKLGGYTVGLLANIGSFWVGAHYSNYNRRWCINPLPCLTVWVALPGGKCP